MNVMLAIRRRAGVKERSILPALDRTPPYLRPGYQPPVAPSAADLMRKRAKWPLVWVTDIHGYDALSSRSSGQASFSLTQPGEVGAGASFSCRVPLHEGALFGKEGAYLVVVVPATDEEQVGRILRAAEGA
jgi:hypothetical protein